MESVQYTFTSSTATIYSIVKQRPEVESGYLGALDGLSKYLNTRCTSQYTFLVSEKCAVYFQIQGHHYRSQGETEARYRIRASRGPRQHIRVSKYLLYLQCTFGTLFTLPRKKCVFLQVKSVRRTFRPRAATSNPIAKPRPDMETGWLGAYYRILKQPYIYSYWVGFRYYHFYTKSARRTFAYRATTIGPMVKRRPDTESGRQDALGGLSKHLNIRHTFGALFAQSAYKKCAAHFCIQGHHYQVYSKTETRYGIRASRSPRWHIRTSKYLPHFSRTLRALLALPRKKVRFSLSQKCAAHFWLQGHHRGFYGKTESGYGIRASRSPRQGIKTPKYLPYFMAHFSHTFCLVSNRQSIGHVSAPSTTATIYLEIIREKAIIEAKVVKNRWVSN